MDRRRLLVVAAVAAGVTLLVLGRPGADDEPPGDPAGQPGNQAGQPADQAGERPDGAGAPARTDPPADRSVEPSTSPVPAPHEEGGVAGDETLAPADAREALRAAERFAEIWVGEASRGAEAGREAGESGWLGRLAELATPALAAALAGADPPRPARELTGAGSVYFDTPQWARVGIPAEGGTVVLDVVAAGDRWLVSAVDWRPA